MGRINRYIALLLTPLMMVCNFPLLAVAQEQQKQPTAEIVHNPVETAMAGQRVNLKAEIEDKNGIEVVRVYFKAEDGANYNFVEMAPDNINTPLINATYSAVLPAPANGARSFTYLILIKNSFNVVVKSQNYWVKVEPSPAPQPTGETPLKVYTELDKAPAEITGFSDNIAFDAVEPAAKFGVVAGLYQTVKRGAVGVVYGGTVAASQEGIGTGTIILGSVAAAAIVGGVIALASSGGGDSGSTTTPTPATCSYQGTWTGTFSETDCSSSSTSDTWSGTVDASCIFTATADLTNVAFLSGTINTETGAISVAGTRTGCTQPITGTATFGTNSVSGSYTGGANGTFAGTKQ